MLLPLYHRDPRHFHTTFGEDLPDKRPPYRIPRLWNPSNRVLSLRDGGFNTTLDESYVIPHVPIVTLRGPQNVTLGTFRKETLDDVQIPATMMTFAWQQAFLGGGRVRG